MWIWWHWENFQRDHLWVHEWYVWEDQSAFWFGDSHTRSPGLPRCCQGVARNEEWQGHYTLGNSKWNMEDHHQPQQGFQKTKIWYWTQKKITIPTKVLKFLIGRLSSQKVQTYYKFKEDLACAIQYSKNPLVIYLMRPLAMMWGAYMPLTHGAKYRSRQRWRTTSW